MPLHLLELPARLSLFSTDDLSGLAKKKYNGRLLTFRSKYQILNIHGFRKNSNTANINCKREQEKTYGDVGQFGNKEFPFVAVGGQTITIVYIKSITDRLCSQKQCNIYSSM